MNIPKIEVAQDKARQAFQEYRLSVQERRNDEDVAIMRGYKELAKGNALIDLSQVFEQCPCDELGRPKLAIAPATNKTVYCKLGWCGRNVYFYWGKALHRYGWMDDYCTRSIIKTTLPFSKVRKNSGDRYHQTPVPNIPPLLRPKRFTTKHFILWEVDEWERVPGDPILLRHIGGALYVVLAQWDLTPLEQAVLKGTRPIN